MLLSRRETDVEKKTKSLFSGLGKSTLRGIKRCPKCFTCNGTRSLSCKNKNCDVVFKEAGEKKKHSVDVCQLDTGTSTRVYSVKVKDKGPECRGFVQLPILQPKLVSGGDDYLNQVSALCFVDSCQRLFDTNLLKCHERQMLPSTNIVPCSHILSATKCCADSYPINIDYDVLQTLQMPDSMREEIIRRVNESSGPLVQRVSKAVMAVRCEVTTTDPLGFLHVSFVASPRCKDIQWHCSCTPPEFQTSCKKNEKKSSHCIHYYACIAAFASDPKLSVEFEKLIENESDPIETLNIVLSDVEEPLSAILSDESVKSNGKVEVIRNDLMLSEIGQDFDELTPSVSEELPFDPMADHSFGLSVKQPVPVKNTLVSKRHPKRLKTLAAKNSKRKLLASQVKLQPVTAFANPVVENELNFPFLDWLASVTERINRSINFENSEKPVSLIFHVPYDFFECFKARVIGYCYSAARKLYSPLSLETPFRKDFNCYITNMAHAKAVFATPKISLRVTKTFTKNADGSFIETDAQTEASKRLGSYSFRSQEYTTFLKIDNSSQTVPSGLSIDWTADFLPISKVGELRITFELGHMQVFDCDVEK